MTHWATKYIGIPWSRGASGPDSYDCWGFAVEVEREIYGRKLPDIADRDLTTMQASRTIRDHSERHNWVEVESPTDGDLVLMSRRNVPAHIGIWVIAGGRGGVLHCLERAGVVFSQRHAIQAHGFGGIHFYHPK